VIGAHDTVVDDPDHVQRATWGTDVLSFR
jgi:para-nitrobenzyl esterase